MCYCNGTVQPSLSNHCCICFLGGSVEIAKEEEQAASWEAGKYKCISSVEMFWYYCDGTHAESSWLSAVELWL